MSNQQALHNLLGTQLGAAQSLLSYLHDAQWRLCCANHTLGAQDFVTVNPAPPDIISEEEKKRLDKVPIDGVHRYAPICPGTQNTTS